MTDSEFMMHLFKRCSGQYHLLGKVDSETQIVTFPLWNLSGQMVGFQQYNWRGDKKKNNNREGKYWTYTPAGRIVPAWGYEYLSLDKGNILFVTEGVFDAISVMKLGYNCIATMTNHPKPLKQQLRVLPYTTVAICDGDNAGRKLASVCDCGIILPDGEDANSMKPEELGEVVENWRKKHVLL